MEKGGKRFLFNCDWYQTLRRLDDTSRLRVLDAVVDYVGGNEAAGLDAAECAVFDFIRKEIDKDQAISDRRSEAGKRGGARGGAPRGNKNACKKFRQNKQNNQMEVVLTQLHENEQDSGQNKAKQSKTKQNKAKQSKTKQTTQLYENEQDSMAKTSKTKQNEARRSKTKQITQLYENEEDMTVKTTKNNQKQPKTTKNNRTIICSQLHENEQDIATKTTQTLTRARARNEESREKKDNKEKYTLFKSLQKEKNERKESDIRTPYPPTMGEVAAFATANGIDLQMARRFFQHYQTNGWMIGQSRIRDWRAVLTKWKETQGQNDISQGRADDLLHYPYENADPAAINDRAERELAELRKKYGSIL